MENLENIKITDEDIQKFYDSLIERKLFSLGEVIDKIEYGLIAESVFGSDSGLCISVDKDGQLYWIDGIKLINEDQKVDYSFSIIKKPTEEVPLHRYFIRKLDVDPIVYSEEENK